MITSPDPNISYQLTHGVFVMQIQRPEKKNALTQTMYQALAQGISAAEKDDDARVILIRGSEDCFTSGNDVNDFVKSSDVGTERPSVQFMKAIAHAGKPVVAAVGGLAIGIGTTMLLHCDLVYAAEDAYFQLPFTRLGLCPEAGSSALLPQILGHQRASELLLLGDRFSAAKAHQYGMVNEVLPSAGYLEHAMAKATELAKLPADAVRTSKALIKRNQASPMNDTIQAELLQFSRLLQSPDAQAIFQAFLNKKK
ncbi:enoyl-CoA hydratase [Pseudohongiella sp. SYSU M77423]|uniref:enoyl-CoA hydratase n=1 Tax=unclassified Pseudohongiella TaxID=2629611 RepID=UPI001F1E066A|nr:MULTISPECIES: enoyl-CoA hydratase [unclassified Pseudohongiella]MDH7944522.1 enoyl-CoA hydratase [Pseudohongiella sp. SYSU M77423]